MFGLRHILPMTWSGQRSGMNLMSSTKVSSVFGNFGRYYSSRMGTESWKEKDNSHIYLRAETLHDEQRTPLVPTDAKNLINQGYRLTVEKSSQRIFQDEEYEEVGCEMVSENNWLQNPDSISKDAFILGLKYLCPPESKWAKSLTCGHRHIYFAHCFKEQAGWENEIGRFKNGGGQILDLEFLTDEKGRRVASFGYFAGYCGAALGVAQFYIRQNQLPHMTVKPFKSSRDLHAFVTTLCPREFNAETPAAVVVGALGAAGQGAVAFLRELATSSPDSPKVQVSEYDIPEMNEPNARESLLKHEILVNCINLQGPTPPFVTKEGYQKNGPHRLAVVVDVSCDPSSPYNPIPIYEEETELEHPALEQPNLPDVVAVSHLPTLLPREASSHFSKLIVPHLETLKNENKRDVWNRAVDKFDEICQAAN